MSITRPKKLNSFGDTIVEVMVVLAVLSMALSVSYATADRSLLNIRQAQENEQATELAQGQVEELRTLTAPASPVNIFTAGGYCLSTTAPYTKLPSCGFNYGGQPAPAVSALYTLKTTYAAVNSSGGTFTVTVTWPDVQGQGTDSIQLVYRLYQSS
jgi:type II secretory pathway pseudopilin PulG